MKPLRVEEAPDIFGGGMKTLIVSGFGDGELAGLKRIPHAQAREELMTMLDERNSGMGTQLQCGVGVYGIWFDNENAYMNVGNSCD